MPKFTIRLVCGHIQGLVAKAAPAWLDSEAGYSVFWCSRCKHSQRVSAIEPAQRDGDADG